MTGGVKPWRSAVAPVPAMGSSADAELLRRLLGALVESARVDSRPLRRNRQHNSYEAEFPADLSRLADVRRTTLTHARAWGADDVTAHDAALIVDELFANAVRHGSRPGDPVTLSLTLDWPELHIAVGDTSRGVPVRRSAAPEDESGRGLFLVDALAARWGADPDGPGKRTWAVLTLPVSRTGRELQPAASKVPGRPCTTTGETT